MKTFLVVWFFLAASEGCYDNHCMSEGDEVKLFQVRSQDERAKIPGLDELLQPTNETKEIAKNMSKNGITSVPGELTSALDKADYQIYTATQKFNASVEAFYASANMTNDEAQNLTRLQNLVTNIVQNLIPCYNATMTNVNKAVSASKMVLPAMGHKELQDTLDECQATTVGKVIKLILAAEEMGNTVTNVTNSSSSINEALEAMKSQTQLAVDLAKDLKEQVNEKIQTFGTGLEPKLKLALGPGDEAARNITGLTNATETLFGNLEAFVELVNTELPKCGESLSPPKPEKKNIFKRVFGGLFR